MERLIDLAARQCGFDRIELRRRNLVPRSRDAVPQPVRHGLRQRRLSRGDGARAGARRLGRLSRRAAPRRSERGKLPRHRRRQLRRHRDRRAARARRDHRAAGRHGRGGASARCRSGQGHETSFAQLVTEWLGVPLEQRAAGHRRHRPRVGRRRLAFRPRACGSAASSCWNASNEIIDKGMRIAGHAAGGCGRRSSNSPTAASPSKGTDRSIGLFEVAARGACSATTCRTICAARCAAIGDETVNAARLSLRLPRLRGRGRSGHRRGRDRALLPRSTMSAARSIR